MTFPGSGPGYPQQGGGAQHVPQSQGAGQYAPPAPQQQRSMQVNFGLILALGVAVLGIVQYFIGFSDDAGDSGSVTSFLLVGGLLAALRLLPKSPNVLPFAALFSVLGALEVIDQVIGYPSVTPVPGIVVAILILGILQLLVAVAALLFDHNILTMPSPKPQAPQGPYGQQQFPPPGQYQGQPGQQAPFGQQPGQGPGEASGPFSQPTQYGPPVTSPGQSAPGAQPGGQSGAGGQSAGSGQPIQQPTTYAPQQGQFYQQQQQSESGQQSPGTPPGGFGQQS